MTAQELVDSLEAIRDAINVIDGQAAGAFPGVGRRDRVPEWPRVLEAINAITGELADVRAWAIEQTAAARRDRESGGG